MRLKQLDIYFIFFFLLLATISIYKLFILRPLETNKKVKVQARIVLQENSVKRKRYDHLAWIDSRVGDSLNFDDQIYTHHNSKAQLQFLDGHKLQLLEKTLFKITIDDNDQSMVWELGEGSISADVSAPVTLKLAGKELKINTQKAKIEITQENNLSKVALLEGDAEVKSGKQKIKLKQNLFLELKNKHLKTKRLDIITLSPQNGQKIYYDYKSTITFKWKLKDKFNELYLYLAHDKSFKDTIRKIKLDPSKTSYQLNDLFKKVYYWKMAGKKRTATKLQWSHRRFFYLLKNLPPEILSPLHQSNFWYINPPQKIIFKWRKSRFKRYQIEIVDPNKKSIKNVIKKNNYVLQNMQFGKYKWKICNVVSNSKKLICSPFYTFSIKEILRSNPPLILAPIDGKEIRSFARDNTFVDIRFRKIEGIKDYQIRWEVNGKIFDKQIKGEFYKLKAKEGGNYTLKIRSIDKYGRPSAFSKHINFKVSFIENNLLRPKEGVKIFLNKPKQKIRFEWKDQKRTKFIFEISKDSSFKNILKSRKTDKSYIETSLMETGVYYWRTQEVKKDGQVTYALPVKIEIFPIPPLPKPQIIPEESLEIQIKESGQSSFNFINIFISKAWAGPPVSEVQKFVKLKWPGHPDVREYILKIYKDKNKEKLLLKKKLTTPSYEWINPPLGTFYWHVATIDYWDRESSFSDISTLHITWPKNLSKLKEPVLISPSNNQKIEESISNSIGLTFHWKSDKQSKKSILGLYKDKDLKKLIYQTETDKSKLRVKNFPNEKIIYWHVTDFDIYGRKSISKRNKVIIYKKEIKKTRKKVQKMMNHVDWLLIAWNPVRIDYQLEHPSYLTTITGEIWNSFFLNLWYMFTSHFGVDLNLYRKSGQVFTNLNYQELGAYLLVGYKWEIFKKFSLTPKLGLIYQDLSTYSMISSTTLTEKRYNSFDLLSELEMEYRISSSWSNKTNLSIGFKNIFMFKGRITINYFFKERIFMSIGPSFLYRQFKHNASKIKISEIQLLGGVGGYF